MQLESLGQWGIHSQNLRETWISKVQAITVITVIPLFLQMVTTV